MLCSIVMIRKDKAVKVASYAITFVVSMGKGLTRLPERLVDEQQRYQWGEIVLLHQAQTNVSTSDIQKWDLKLDKNGLWRVWGRLGKLELSRHPIFLPRQHPITTMLLMRAHKECGHFGVSHTLCQFRERFWIEKGRRTAKRVIGQECLRCKRYAAKPFQAVDHLIHMFSDTSRTHRHNTRYVFSGISECIQTVYSS